jgi:hypothetical protein
MTGLKKKSNLNLIKHNKVLNNQFNKKLKDKILNKKSNPMKHKLTKQLNKAQITHKHLKKLKNQKHQRKSLLK